MREVEDLRFSITLITQSLLGILFKLKNSNDTLSLEDRKDSKLNAKTVQFQLKKVKPLIFRDGTHETRECDFEQGVQQLEGKYSSVITRDGDIIASLLFSFLTQI